MPDVRQLDPADLLAWVVTSDIEPKVASDLIRVGVTDTALIESVRTRGHSFNDQAAALAAIGTEAAPDQIIDQLQRVGHRILSADLANLDEWAAIGDRVKTLHTSVRRYRADADPTNTMDEIFAAGRSPSFARELLDVAEEAGSYLNAYGFGLEITPVSYRALNTAGITDRKHLDKYLSYGLGLSDAIGLAADGVTDSAVAAAVATSLPVNQWRAVLPGLNARWFPTASDHSRGDLDPTTGILAKADATWEALRELADGGWADADTRNFAPGMAWKNDGFGPTTIDTALTAARAGISFTEAQKWGTALHIGKRGADWCDQSLPPVLGFGKPLATVLDTIVTLRELGAKHSWVAEYRACGARTTEDLITLARLGITAKIAGALRAEHGEARWDRGPKRFKRIEDLIAVHEGRSFTRRF